MWQHVATLVAEWGADLVGEVGLSPVGAVVGATHPRAVAEARKLMPQAVLLLPGVGAQGAMPGRPRARVHERPGERARQRLALGDLRVPREPAPTTAQAAGAEAARLQQRDLGRLRLVAAPDVVAVATSAPGGVPARRDDRRRAHPRRPRRRAAPAERLRRAGARSRRRPATHAGDAQRRRRSSGSSSAGDTLRGDRRPRPASPVDAHPAAQPDGSSRPRSSSARRIRLR